jgi:hypothetical protein
MSFFKKLFGAGYNKGFTFEQQQSNSSNPKRTIFDFFQIDLKNIPDDSFIEGETEENTSGQSVQKFRKTLTYKECGIFDTVEVIVIDGTNKNVFFKSFNPDRINFDSLKRLIDELYLIHGNDFDNKGKFNSKDKKEYLDTDFYLLFGRNWTSFPKYKYPLSISRDDEEVSISIWGIHK